MAVDILPPFDVSVQSSDKAVREALSKLLGALGPLALDIEEAGTVELVVAEALNNIVEHAYPNIEAPGPIDIHCEHKKDGLHLQIKDTGHSMPDGKMPIGQPASLDVDLMDLPEGGFGWFLIQDLAKDVSYARVGSENLLHLRLAVGLSHVRT
jgi:serine/threonine-protein kinase RsbW